MPDDEPTTEPTSEPAGDPQPSPVPAPDDEPLGAGGLRALQAEREARKALEQQMAALAPLQQLAQALAGDGRQGDGRSEVEILREQFDAHQAELAAERVARWRAEIAAEKQLPAGLAARLQGATREELAADADQLLTLIPAPAAGPRTPVPDLSQGSRGPVDIDALIRDAEATGNVREAIRLKNQKLHVR